MKAILALAFLGFSTLLLAQQVDEIAAYNSKEGDASAAPIAIVEGEEAFPHSIAAKLLFVDYGIAAPGEGSITNGIELTYLRRINEIITVAAPLKLGVLNVAEDPGTKRSFFGVDATAQAGYSFLNDRVRPYAMAGLGIVFERNNGANLQVPLGAGVSFRISEAAYVTGQFEYRPSSASDRSNKQVGIGLLFNLGRGQFNPEFWDTDGDGIMDNEDQCIEVRGSRLMKGCPDSDGDGINDAADPCPNHYGTKKDGGCPDSDGDGIGDPYDTCPEEAGVAERAGCPIPDRDGDGVADEDDKCPDIAGKLLGCPDTDADGISDLEDECPKQAGPKSTNGCPDRDNDGFADIKDNCPLLPGDLNGCPDRDKDGVDDASDRCPNIAGEHNGCPEILQSQQQLFEFAVRAIGFEEGSNTLSQYAYEHLNGLADMMNEFDDYKLAVTGHSDFGELVTDREQFSLTRAQACANYLQSRGVDASRIVVDGIGAGRPLRRQGTSEERGVNRRVEFDLFRE